MFKNSSSTFLLFLLLPLLPTPSSPGDDGTSKEAVSTGKLNQENEHIYNLWCSGRVCCEGMLIQLKVGHPAVGSG